MAKKVLVVDDELDVRTFVSTLLETSGYKPLPAVDGKEGMVIARKEKPAVVILDVMMPNESGIGMYRELKTDPDLKDIPVIMLSALSRKTFSIPKKSWMNIKGKKYRNRQLTSKNRPNRTSFWKRSKLVLNRDCF